jgi:predicted dinucleotide-binding enzyme
MASLKVLAEAGTANLSGKILMDVANPLDLSRGFPPSLNPVNTDSLAEEIQRAFPEAKVVKTLNTMTNSVMVDPGRVAGGDHTVFVSGNDAGAKTAVTEILTALGHKDVLDLGDITTARGAEMVLPLWLRVWGALGTGEFNFKIAR